MKTRKLRDIEVSEVGMGCMAFSHGYGRILPEAYSIEAIRGAYNHGCTFFDTAEAMLLDFMVMQPISGILMSKHLYPFIRIPGASAWTRELHLLFAYWGFALMCVHAGTHLYAPMKKLRLQRRRLWIIVMGLLGAVSVYGSYVFVKRQFLEYMLRRAMFVFFDYGEPRIFSILDYHAVMVLFAFLGMCISCVFASAEQRGCRSGMQA